MKINERIKDVRKALDLNQSEFAKKLGIGQAAISALEKGIRNITDQTILLLCSTYNVNEDYLRNGIGSMFNKEEVFSLDKYAKERGASAIDIEILKIYLNLDKDVRKKIVSDFKKAVLEEEFSNPHSSENTNNEISATIESTVQEESDKIPLYFKPAHKMTDEEIEEEVAEYRRELLLEKKQAEKSSVSLPQENGCKKWHKPKTQEMIK